ncbi:hypothetical protein PILCRDRAFT_820937 [Piloderma croceum F 1598]|uniref:Uncharacterized protein n=1 Tax=Piloderma croceum (strain F 1598) TaxID=765440 RepID=A0A0C3FS78_PILCF|nr:hypothetical protein PILCRDRAFT_820937 [Piloderma croceum F 1598]
MDRTLCCIQRLKRYPFKTVYRDGLNYSTVQEYGDIQESGSYAMSTWDSLTGQRQYIRLSDVLILIHGHAETIQICLGHSAEASPWVPSGFPMNKFSSCGSSTGGRRKSMGESSDGNL